MYLSYGVLVLGTVISVQAAAIVSSESILPTPGTIGTTSNSTTLYSNTITHSDGELASHRLLERTEQTTTVPKAVFAHYMVGTITEEHAQQDIKDAMGMGIDGFALNIGNAFEDFVDPTLHYLFDYAETVGFSLYISMDVYASGASCYAGGTSCNGPWDYKSIFTWALGSSAYYLGPNGFPMISTFSSGGFTNEDWKNWKETLVNQMYFIPDFDETTGYYLGENSYDGWYYYWGSLVDGLFSWESAWPQRGTPLAGTVGGAYSGDVTPDVVVQKGALARDKHYMIGLSALQYKNSYGANVYRAGDATLLNRMVGILSMETAPNWVVIQTWNDGPESHYIGNLWPEQNDDDEPAAYMGEDWPHTAWQPIIQAFINAYKEGGGISDMVTPVYDDTPRYAQGALWYRTILMSAECTNDDGIVNGTKEELYWEKPLGFDSGRDEVNWAIVMPRGTQDYTISVYSGDSLVLSGRKLIPGLNFGSIPEVNPGVQTMQVLDPNGNIFMTATGGMCVSSECTGYIYNMNYQVLPLVLGTASGTCFYNDANDDADDTDLPDTDPLSDCDATYSTIEEVSDAAGDIPEHCLTLYTLVALGNLLDETVSNYTDVLNNGYDGKFNTYSKAVAASVDDTVHDFVYENGDKYFTCMISETTVCCDHCSSDSDSQCNYCFDGKCYKTCQGGVCNRDLSMSMPILEARLDNHPTQVLNTKISNETEPCPPDYSKRGYGPDNPYEQSIYWTLVDSNGFYDALEANTSIPQAKIAISNYNRGNDCAPTAKPGDDCWAVGYDYDIPVPSGYSASDVANPKDIASKVLESAKALGSQIQSVIDLLRMDGWLGDGSELVDSISMPIFMLASAVESMAEVETIAEEITAAKRKAILLAFLSAILFFVPVIGEIAGAVAELGDITVILEVLGAAGNAADDIYTIVKDPDNAPLAIFDLILTPLALTDIVTVSKASNLRRAMATDDVSKLGSKVGDRLETIENIKGKCLPDLVDDTD